MIIVGLGFAQLLRIHRILHIVIDCFVKDAVLDPGEIVTLLVVYIL